MITAVTPYLTFNDNCEDALNFYVRALKADIRMISRGKDSPPEHQQKGFENNVMHAELKVGHGTILASDSFGRKVPAGENYSLTLNFENVDELNEAWQKMSDGANITMQLGDMFWGARFGMMRDKFGVNWMFNCEKKQK